LGKLVANAGSVSQGQKVFNTHCVTCHGDKAEGKIGPNLTDKFWLNGDGSLMSIYKVVDQGVADKGMVPWGGTLSPGDLRKVVAYVGSVRDTNIPGKEPQGDIPGKNKPPSDAPAAAENTPTAAEPDAAPKGADAEL
ncbi:MAG: cytochrome c, partial [Myxococcota bacterium]